MKCKIVELKNSTREKPKERYTNVEKNQNIIRLTAQRLKHEEKTFQGEINDLNSRARPYRLNTN